MLRLALSTLMFASIAAAQSTQPTIPAPDAQGIVKLPNVTIDTKAKQIRIEATTLAPEMPLEFLCVTAGGPEHESVVRTSAKPSFIHAGLLMLGLEPGATVHFSEAAKKWVPPYGPPIQVSFEWQKDGVTQKVPAYRWLRSVKDKKERGPMLWIFAGSRQSPDGYAADFTGYVVSLVNFELSMIDVPQLASNSNETLEWEYNTALAPPLGTAVTMIIEPAKEVAAGQAPSTMPATTTQAGIGTPLVPPDFDAEMARLRQSWEASVNPHAQALRDAAQTHYDVLKQLRQRQQLLLDEADRIQRLIDELDEQYQTMTTPRPQ